MRGVLIFPALLIPIVHMLAQHDQPRARNRLKRVQLLQKSICRWARGAALRSKEFNQNGGGGGAVLSKPSHKTTHYETSAGRRKQATLFEHPIQAHYHMPMIMDAR